MNVKHPYAKKKRINQKEIFIQINMNKMKKKALKKLLQIIQIHKFKPKFLYEI